MNAVGPAGSEVIVVEHGRELDRALRRRRERLLVCQRPIADLAGAVSPARVEAGAEADEGERGGLGVRRCDDVRHRIKQITLKGVRDLLQALLAMERATIELTMLNITPEQIFEIRSIHDQINKAIRERDSLHITYFNSQFHRLIAKASDNEYL